MCARSETGYLQRRLVKAMEDCKIQHDLTVRNASGFVVQFLYGEDGMDPIKLEYQELPTLSLDAAAMRAPYLLASAAELRGHVRPALLEALQRDEAAWRPRMEAHFAALVQDRRAVIQGLCEGLSTDTPIVYPVHVGRIVRSAAELARKVGCPDGLSDLDPRDVLDTIDALIAELRLGGFRDEEERDAVHWMPVLLRCFLSPKEVIVRHHLNKVAFAHVVRQIQEGFFAAIASPGEMVGIVAAMSIGESMMSHRQQGASLVMRGSW